LFFPAKVQRAGPVEKTVSAHFLRVIASGVTEERRDLSDSLPAL
jgi:hypothetical protein